MDQVLITSDKALVPKETRTRWDEEIDRRKAELQQYKGEA